MGIGMKLESQVCSLELAKRLKAFGVKQDSLFEWVRCSTLNEWVWRLLERDDDDRVNERIAAFTVAELGEMLPAWVIYQKCNAGWLAEEGVMRVHFDEKNEADARAKMLIYMIKNKLVKP